MASRTAERLAVRRAKLVAQLSDVGPVLRASLIERFTQCGKPGCKCMRGEKHGPAYYLTVSYAKGKTRQVYVPKDQDIGHYVTERIQRVPGIRDTFTIMALKAF